MKEDANKGNNDDDYDCPSNVRILEAGDPLSKD